MNTDWLYTFRLVVRLGSFTKAGERLFMSQPGVSAHVKQLEQFFGTELLVRKGAQIEPTPAGSAVLELAEKFEELLADARNRLAGDEGQAIPLIIGSSPTPATYVLPSLIAQYRKGLPGALVQVISMTVAEAKDKLMSGEIDFGVLSAGLLNDDLAAEPLIRTKLWLIAPPSHPLAGCPAPLPEMIAEFPFLLLGPGMESHRLVKMWALDHGISLNAVMESNSHDGLGQAVQLGLGLAFAGGPQIVQDIRDGRLVALNAPDTPLELSLYFAHRRDVHTPAKARLLSCFRGAKWRLDTPAFL